MFWWTIHFMNVSKRTTQLCFSLIHHGQYFVICLSKNKMNEIGILKSYFDVRMQLNAFFDSLSESFHFSVFSEVQWSPLSTGICPQNIPRQGGDPSMFLDPPPHFDRGLFGKKGRRIVFIIRIKKIVGVFSFKWDWL